MPVPTVKPLNFYDDWDYYAGTSYERIAKTDDRAKYRLASDNEKTDNKRCYGCRFYSWGTCNLVEGTIEANNLCDMFTATPLLYPMDMSRVVGKGRAMALMIETAKFKEQTAPDWIQYYPAPGRFNHPSYGEIVITEQGNKLIVDNMNNHVYQNAIPIDCEHDLVVSGAVGWIDKMRVAADGSVEAHVDWNERGTNLIAQDRFRYFSPSIIPLWPHTETGEDIPNVAVGGAICTQPYFKESWLRPLVATEGGGLEAYQRGKPDETGVREVRIVSFDSLPLNRQEEKKMPTEGDESKGTATTPPAVTQFTAAEIQAFRDFQTLGGLAKFSELIDTVKEQAGTISSLNTRSRETHFRDLIGGYETFADNTRKKGAPWIGAVADHLVQLGDIAERHGIESEQFNSYVRIQRTQAASLRENPNFREVGTSEGAENIGDNPIEMFNEKVKAIQTANPTLTYRAVLKRAEQENPELFAEQREALTVKV